MKPVAAAEPTPPVWFVAQAEVPPLTETAARLLVELIRRAHAGDKAEGNTAA
jgi:hypothetical protein